MAGKTNSFGEEWTAGVSFSYPSDLHFSIVQEFFSQHLNEKGTVIHPIPDKFEIRTRFQLEARNRTNAVAKTEKITNPLINGELGGVVLKEMLLFRSAELLIGPIDQLAARRLWKLISQPEISPQEPLPDISAQIYQFPARLTGGSPFAGR